MTTANDTPRENTLHERRVAVFDRLIRMHGEDFEALILRAEIPSQYLPSDFAPQVYRARDAVSDDAWLGRLEKLLEVRRVLRPPGLAPFQERDVDLYVPPRDDLASVMARLPPKGATRWLRIEGDPGVGKSSFARAGVVPALRSATAPRATHVVVMRPSTNPVIELASELQHASLWDHRGRTRPSVEQLLELVQQPARFELKLRELTHDELLVLLVDQLEELVTVAGSASALTKGFARAIHALLAAPNTLLITTVRSDWRDEAYKVMPAVEPSLVTGAPLRQPDEPRVREILLGLHTRGRLTSDDGVRAALVEDLLPSGSGGGAGEGACLPALGLIIEQVWERSNAAQRGACDLTHDVYAAVRAQNVGVLERAMEELLGSLQGEDGALLKIARQIVRRLVHVEGPVERMRFTRKPRELRDLYDRDGTQRALEERVLYRLTGGAAGKPTHARLLTLTLAPGVKQAVRADLIHDDVLKTKAIRALIGTDPSLADACLLSQLALAWHHDGRGTRHLLNKEQLTLFNKLKEEDPALLGPIELDLLNASARALRPAWRASRSPWLWIPAASLAAVIVVLVSAQVLESKRVADERRAIDAMMSARDRREFVAATLRLLDLWRRCDRFGDRRPPEHVGMLAHAAGRNFLPVWTSRTQVAAFDARLDASGVEVIGTCPEGVASELCVQRIGRDGRVGDVRPVRIEGLGVVADVRFASEDGRYAALRSDGRVLVVDRSAQPPTAHTLLVARSGDVDMIVSDAQECVVATDRVNAARWSVAEATSTWGFFRGFDGTLLGAGLRCREQVFRRGSEAGVELWGDDNLDESFRVSSSPNVATFAPDDHSLAFGTEDGAVFIVEDQSRAVHALDGPHAREGIASAAFDRRGGRLLTASPRAGEAHLWNLTTYALETPVFQLGERPLARFVASGRGVLTVDVDGPVRLWGACAPAWCEMRAGSDVGEADARGAVTRDGRWLLVSGDDGVVRLWSADTGAEFDRHRFDSPASVVFSSDGARHAFVGARSVYIGATTGAFARELQPQLGPLLPSTAAFVGQRFVAALESGEVGQWHLGPAASARRVEGLLGPKISSLAACQDDRHVVIAGARQAGLWNLDDDSLSRWEFAGRANVIAVACDAASSRGLVVDDHGVVESWDLRVSSRPSGVRLPSSFTIPGGLRRVRPTDHARAVIGFPVGGVQVWEVSTGRALLPPSLVAGAADAACSAGCRWVVVAKGTTASLWSRRESRIIATFDGSAPLRRVTLSEDGSILTMSSDDGTTRRVSTMPGAILDGLCRGLTAVANTGEVPRETLHGVCGERSLTIPW